MTVFTVILTWKLISEFTDSLEVILLYHGVNVKGKTDEKHHKLKFPASFHL